MLNRYERSTNQQLWVWLVASLVVAVIIILYILSPFGSSGVSKAEIGSSETGHNGVTEQTSADRTTSEPTEEGTILTEDNRSVALRNATAGWNTNWNRRTIEFDELLSGGPPRDGIPSLDNPGFVNAEEAATWLAGNDGFIALEIDGDARAYPLQILTWHEIVNDTVGDVPVAVTFCPLCNSALTFDRRFDDGNEVRTFEFGTSGLLRNSDLVMYDRSTETLWQQFTGEGLVGDLAGEQLTFVASSIVSFDDFRQAHPDGLISSLR